MHSYRSLLAVPLTLLAVCSCGSETGPADSNGVQAADVADVLVRERVAHYAQAAEWPQARTELAPLLERKQPAIEDLLRGALIELQDHRLEASSALVEAVLEREPDNPAALYLKGRTLSMDFDRFAEAEAALRRVRQLAPQDLAARYALARLLEEKDYPDDAAYEAGTEEASRLYDEILEVGLENGTRWYVSAVFRKFMIAQSSGDEVERAEFTQKWNALHDLGAEAVKDNALNEGQLAGISPPRTPATVDPTPAVPDFALAGLVLPEFGGARRLVPIDLDEDRLVDLVALAEDGLWVSIQEDDGSFAAPQRIVEGAVDAVAFTNPFPFGFVDVIVAQGGALQLIDHDEAGFTPSGVPLPALPAAPTELVPVDFDHDGDLDLAAVGSFGARLLRDDGAGRLAETPEGWTRGAFTDVTAEAGIPTDRAFHQVVPEDYDADQDVDLLFVGPAGSFLADSLRGGRFREAAVFGSSSPAGALAVADLDGDARTDIFELHAGQARLWRQDAAGRFTLEDLGVAGDDGRRPVLKDLDQDGVVDALWARDGALAAGVLAPGYGPEQRLAFALKTEGQGGSSVDLAAVDIDRVREPHLALELLRLTTAGVEVYRTDPKQLGNVLRLKYFGVKDNRPAVGALVEVRAGGVYRRIFWTGVEELVGIGEQEYSDVVRVTWPNGVVSSELDLDRGDQVFLDDPEFGKQPKGLIGSCPFLYTWNGETYEFISDVLGITPLGLPMAPGMLVPPDHDEYVLVRGDQLVAKDGFFELQFTEELREVTYLDQVRLEAIDHPVGTEIYPNERFCFPPFPEHHVHTVRQALAPIRALGPEGEDWSAALAKIDDIHAVPFRPLDDQFLGLATPHYLDLSYDAEAVAEAEQLRLVMTGWFYWTDASVNVAAARTPGVDFVPPTLQVRDADGQWVAAGPPLGFPAGKTKTMVIDVTELLKTHGPRFRLASTLRLYWDSIRLATDGDDAAQITRFLMPSSAELWPRGFSAPLAAERADLPERFDWNVLADKQRWNQHPGMYTRFGECLELVTDVDDRFVVMGSGDCLTIRVPADTLQPPRAGYVRDYLVYLDGWAKDRDPNTVEALTVEPLPFHGMSGYPYGPDESFPDTALHQAWRSEWQTRPGATLVAPLAPARFAEWLER